MDEWLMRNLLNEQRNETIIIVSHGGPIRWFLSKWVKGDPNEFWKFEGIGHGKAIIVEFYEKTRTFTLGNKL
jgi:broad specificity phosphatase PhoE